MCTMIKFKTILNYHFLFFLLFALFSCEGKSQSVSESINQKSQFFTFHIGDKTIKAELAVLPKEKQKGLMFREIWSQELECFLSLNEQLHKSFG